MESEEKITIELLGYEYKNIIGLLEKAITEEKFSYLSGWPKVRSKRLKQLEYTIKKMTNRKEQRNNELA